MLFFLKIIFFCFWWRLLNSEKMSDCLGFLFVVENWKKYVIFGWVFPNNRITKHDYIYVFRKMFFLVKFLVFVQTWNRFSSDQGLILSNQCHRYICCTVFLLYVDNFCKIYPYLVLVNQLANLLQLDLSSKVPLTQKSTIPCLICTTKFWSIWLCFAQFIFVWKPFQKSTLLKTPLLLICYNQNHSFKSKLVKKFFVQFHISQWNTSTCWAELPCKSYLELLFPNWLPSLCATSWGKRLLQLICFLRQGFALLGELFPLDDFSQTACLPSRF